MYNEIQYYQVKKAIGWPVKRFELYTGQITHSTVNINCVECITHHQSHKVREAVVASKIVLVSLG